MALLVVANVVLIFGAVAIQYAAGSAALEAELKMMELNLRETETRLSVAEMRADLDTLQRMAGVETRADAARRWRAARSDISLATSKSFSISTTAASAAGAGGGGGGAAAARVFTLGNCRALDVSFTKVGSQDDVPHKEWLP